MRRNTDKPFIFFCRDWVRFGTVVKSVFLGCFQLQSTWYVLGLPGENHQACGPSTSAGAVWGPWVGRPWVTTRQLISCNRRSLAETRKGKTCWLYSRDLQTPFWRCFWVSESFAFSTLLNFHIYPRQFWWELRTKQWSSHWGHPNPHTGAMRSCFDQI